MRSLVMTFLLGALGIVSIPVTTRAEDANTRIATLPYSDCLAIIAEVSHEVGEDPVQMVSNDDETNVRINASDGFVTVSCNRTTNKMVLTKSPVPAAAGMSAAR